jgi:hypothetical protein
MKFWFCAAEFGIFAILAAVKLVRRLSELVSEEDLVDCGVYTVVIGELSSSWLFGTLQLCF